MRLRVRSVAATTLVVSALVWAPTSGVAGGEEREVATPVETATIETGGATFTMFGHPSMTGPVDLAVGPDGSLWFTAQVTNNVGRITPAGQITMFDHPDISNPKQITTGPDGAMWFTIFGDRSVGRITTTGEITIFRNSAMSGPQGIVAGPDGNLWLTAEMSSRIWRLTPEGVFTAMHTAAHPAVREPKEIVVGPDGALWFNNVVGALGRITEDGVLSSFPGGGADTLAFDGSGRVWMPPHGGSFCSCSLQRLTLPSTLQTLSVSPGQPRASHFVLGPDGAMWSAGDQREFMRNTSVAATAPLEVVANGVPHGVQDLIVGPDGNLWFTSFARNVIGRLAFPSSLSGTVTDEVTGEPVAGAWVAAVPTAGGSPVGTVTGPDGSYGLSVLTGEYLVEFVAPDLGHRGEWHPDRALSDLEGAVPVRVDMDGVTVDAALAPTKAAAAGTLTGGSGGPLADGWVATAGVDGVRATTTAPDGAWAMEGLAAGPRLFVFADPVGAHVPEFFDDRHGAPPDVVDLAAGTTTDIDAGLTATPTPGAASTLSGTVSDEATGDPVPGAWVAVVDAASYQFVAGTTAGVDGAYSVGLPAGSYRVEVIDPSGARDGEWHVDVPLGDPGAATPVVMAPGPATVVDVALTPAAGAIDGAVTAEGSGPLGGVWVAAVNANTGAFAGGAVTVGDGSYTLDDLAPGNYLTVYFDPTAAHGFEWHDNASTISDATPTTITTADPHRTIDAALTPV